MVVVKVGRIRWLWPYQVLRHLTRRATGRLTHTFISLPQPVCSSDSNPAALISQAALAYCVSHPHCANNEHVRACKQAVMCKICISAFMLQMQSRFAVIENRSTSYLF